MKYPIVVMGFIPNPAYTITPTTDSTVMIDNKPVLTSFVWTENAEPYASGTVIGNSLFTKANGLPVIILDSTVAPYITQAGQTSTLSD